jgi:hypothetical protein
VAFRRGGAKKRRDANEPAVIEALRGVGATVIQLSGCAPVPDLLVGFQGRWYAVEVKSGQTAGFTDAQLNAMTNGTFAPSVVRSVDEALALVGVRSDAR